MRALITFLVVPVVLQDKHSGVEIKTETEFVFPNVPGSSL